MTFLGLSAKSDSNLQLAMVRNNQLENMAHSGALSEINAQIFAVNSNDESEVDQVILNAIQAPEETIDGVTGTRLDLSGSELLPDVVDNVSGLVQELSLVQPNASYNPPVAGYTIDPDSWSWIQLQYESRVTIPNTTTSSAQTQGIRYIKP